MIWPAIQLAKCRLGCGRDADIHSSTDPLDDPPRCVDLPARFARMTFEPRNRPRENGPRPASAGAVRSPGGAARSAQATALSPPRCRAFTKVEPTPRASHRHVQTAQAPHCRT